VHQVGDKELRFTVLFVRNTENKIQMWVGGCEEHLTYAVFLKCMARFWRHILCTKMTKQIYKNVCPWALSIEL
jgi:hypothetical protein